MKKFLLSLACAVAVFPAFAQDAEVTPAEVITENADGTVTITDNFVAAYTNGATDFTARFALAESADWHIQEDAAVIYRGHGTDYNATNNFVRILGNQGAYLKFYLPNYNCSKIVMNSSRSVKETKIFVYADDEKIGEFEVTVSNGNIEYTIPAEYRAAGTVYKLENQLGPVEGTAYRLHMTGMEFICTPAEVEVKQWAAPTCDIESGDYLVEGQVIRFGWEEGGTLNGKMTYKDKDGVSQAVEIADGKLTVPGNIGFNASITINASVNGKGKDKSEVVQWKCNFNDKSKLLLVPGKQSFTKIEVDRNTGKFHYDLNVLNMDVLSGAVTVQVVLTDAEGVETEYTKVIRYSEQAAAVAETEGEGETEDVEDAAEVSPIAPYNLTGVFEIPSLKKGNYTAKMGAKVGSSANGTYTVLPDPEDGSAFEIANDPEITGIDSIVADDEADAVYYNLNGVRIEPAEGMGMVIRVCNGKATKVII